jgi:hypothetical protein
LSGWGLGLRLQDELKESIMAIFIYQPKSGDRVFAVAHTDSIRVWRWRNGCRHVVGGYRVVVRPQGRRDERANLVGMLSSLIQRFGGVAWDEQGCLTVVTTAEGVQALGHLKAQLLTAQSLQSQESGLADLEPQLALQGVASPKWDAAGSLSWWVNPHSQEPVEVCEVTQFEGKVHIRTSAGDITVPVEWTDGVEGLNPTPSNVVDPVEEEIL